jgi:hypothetical protein
MNKPDPFPHESLTVSSNELRSLRVLAGIPANNFASDDKRNDSAGHVLVDTRQCTGLDERRCESPAVVPLDRAWPSSLVFPDACV